MIKHIWSVLCTHAITDKASNNMSLVEVLEEIQLRVEKGTSKANTTVPFPIYWVTLWARTEQGESSCAHAKDIVIDPSGNTVLDKKYDVDLSEHKRTRFVRNLQGMPVPSSGQYRFHTQLLDEKSHAWDDVSDVPLEITIEMRGL
jgi:hypothetical protein